LVGAVWRGGVTVFGEAKKPKERKAEYVVVILLKPFDKAESSR
jgi:hypothetical protein